MVAKTGDSDRYSKFTSVVRTCRTRTEQGYCSVRVRFEQNRTRISMFEILPNTNRTRVLFGSVRCGAELEQTEQDLENVLFCLFVRLAISAPASTITLDVSNSPRHQQ